MLTIESTRFGKVEIGPSLMSKFDGGMIGFRSHRRYVISSSGARTPAV